MHLIVRRISSFLITVPHHCVLPSIQLSYLLPWGFSEDEMMCIVPLSSHPGDSIGTDLFMEDMATQVVGNGLRWHGGKMLRVWKKRIVGIQG